VRKLSLGRIVDISVIIEKGWFDAYIFKFLIGSILLYSKKYFRLIQSDKGLVFFIFIIIFFAFFFGN